MRGGVSWLELHCQWTMVENTEAKVSTIWRACLLVHWTIADEKHHSKVQCLSHHFRTIFKSTLKMLPLQEQQHPVIIWLMTFLAHIFEIFILLFYFFWALQVFDNFAVTNVCQALVLFSFRLLLPLRRWRGDTRKFDVSWKWIDHGSVITIRRLES